MKHTIQKFIAGISLFSIVSIGFIGSDVFLNAKTKTHQDPLSEIISINFSTNNLNADFITDEIFKYNGPISTSLQSCIDDFDESMSIKNIRGIYNEDIVIPLSRAEILADINPVLGYAVKNNQLNWKYDKVLKTYNFNTHPSDGKIWACYFKNETQFFNQFFKIVEYNTNIIDPICGTIPQTTPVNITTIKEKYPEIFTNTNKDIIQNIENIFTNTSIDLEGGNFNTKILNLSNNFFNGTINEYKYLIGSETFQNYAYIKNLPNTEDSQELVSIFSDNTSKEDMHIPIIFNSSVSETSAIQDITFDKIHNEIYVENNSHELYVYNTNDTKKYKRILNDSQLLRHQGLSIEYKNNESFIWSRPTSDIFDAVRYQFKSNDLGAENIQYFQFFKEKYHTGGAMPTISKDGKYLIIRGAYNTIKVYNIKDLSTGGDYSERYLYKFQFDPNIYGVNENDPTVNPIQGVASDGKYIFIVSGTSSLFKNHLVGYTISGEKIYDDPFFDMGIERAISTGTTFEPEGLDFWTDPISQKTHLMMGMISRDSQRNLIYQIIGKEYNPVKNTIDSLSLVKKTFSSHQNLEGKEFKYLHSGACTNISSNNSYIKSIFIHQNIKEMYTRDTQRKEALLIIANALQEYFDKYKNFTQPERVYTDSSIGSAKENVPYGNVGNWGDDSDLKKLIDEEILTKLPLDPINNTEFHITYEPENDLDAPSYVLCVSKLEITGKKFCMTAKNNSSLTWLLDIQNTEKYKMRADYLDSINYSIQDKKERDITRKSDLQKIANALELHFQKYNSYTQPEVVRYDTSFGPMDQDFRYYQSTGDWGFVSNLQILIKDNHIDILPVDPLNSKINMYVYEPGNSQDTKPSYSLCTTLEETNTQYCIKKEHDLSNN